jgi:hypothetical protein
MGGWELWGVLIVGAAVWILGHLLRQSAEDDNKRGPSRQGPADRRPARPAGQPGQPVRPQQSSSELDRFLQEVARRKQAAEQQRARGEAGQKQQPRRPVRTRQETSDRPPRRRAEVVPQALPVEPVRERSTVDRPLETTVPVARAETPATVLPADVVEVVAQAAPAVTGRLFPPPRRQAAGPALQKLKAMLRTKDDLCAAIILREVLDRPISRRRR